MAVRLDLHAGSRHRVHRRVELQVTDLQHGRTLARTAPHERPQPSGELGEREGLDQVVVGAGIEAAHPVTHPVAGGEHQHRRPALAGAQLTAHLEAVEQRQHRVQHDRVVADLGAAEERVLAVTGDVDGVALFLETPLQQRRHPHLVFDHKNSHASHPQPT